MLPLHVNLHNIFHNWISIIIFLSLILLIKTSEQIKPVSISPDNICTFHIADKLFTLKYIQKNKPYQIQINKTNKLLFNFCNTFIPQQCITTNNSNPQNKTQQILPAFSFILTSSQSTRINPQTNQSQPITKYVCERYSSNSFIYYFSTLYIKHQDQPELLITLKNPQKNRTTEVSIQCSDQDYFKINNYHLDQTNGKIKIFGQSSHGCPVFQISSLWTTLEEHSLILGIILFILGFQMLFYGLLMINLTVFIAGYFISFAILGGIFTVFLGPNSSSISVYFSLLFILLASTLIAYGLTKLINLSIFFIGACNHIIIKNYYIVFGLIVGALVNTLFCGIFSVTSIWSLVIFEVLFTIPFGIMTLKYSNELIIMSTSLTGSYLIVRPLSWLLGGFPNEFVLYEMYQSKELTNIPWSFYFYLLIIIVLAIMGGFYQYLKLQRSDPSNTITTNILTDNIQQPLDKIKSAVDKLIARYSSSENGQQKYKKMKQMEYQTDYLEQPYQSYNNNHHLNNDKNQKNNLNINESTNNYMTEIKYQDTPAAVQKRNSRKSKDSQDYY